ncbi:hypothetical protein [Peribacillus sp. NPDC097895]|uniref:hypothetical protein n=1 Tax=Peribacillus sp. NPDC097895 TaxID=3390619 RepID=UPI003D0849BE
MEDKKSAKERFLDGFLGGVEDWDKHLAEAINNENPYLKNKMLKILEEQEDFGNAINSGLGREMWYSNDFFINSLILDFITDAEDDLVNGLKQIWVGMLGKPGVDAEAINMVAESEGYLIKMHFEMELNIHLISDLVAYHVYGMQIRDMSERVKLLPEMAELLLYLIDKKALLKKATEVAQEDQVDLKSPRSRLHIASELYEAGMKFVLGHEIGHHFLKHTESNGRNIVSKFIPTDVTSNQLHLDEFAADNFGFDLLIRGLKERNDNNLLAPLIVILMLAIYDKTPEEPSQDHPSLRDRYQNLLSRVSEHNEKAACGLQQIFNNVATWINYSLRESGYWKTEWWK